MHSAAVEAHHLVVIGGAAGVADRSGTDRRMSLLEPGQRAGRVVDPEEHLYLSRERGSSGGGGGPVREEDELHHLPRGVARRDGVKDGVVVIQETTDDQLNINGNLITRFKEKKDKGNTLCVN